MNLLEQYAHKFTCFDYSPAKDLAGLIAQAGLNQYELGILQLFTESVTDDMHEFYKFASIQLNLEGGITEAKNIYDGAIGKLKDAIPED